MDNFLVNLMLACYYLVLFGSPVLAFGLVVDAMEKRGYFR